MNEDTNNIEIEDAEGHAAKFRPEASKLEDTDTEGHAMKPRGMEDAETEGHAMKFRPEASKVEDTDTDTEGHMPWIVLPDDQQVADADDTEGHAGRYRG